jgi:NAD(P)H-hydrate epimerase
MMHIVTASIIRSIDSNSIAGNVNTGYSLMRTAAEGLYSEVLRIVKDRSREQIAIVCGKGNNGGDGYLLGCILLDNGLKPMCFGLCDPEELSGAARRAWEEYVSKSGNFFRIVDTEDFKNFVDFTCSVDAILGTGITGNPRGLANETIGIINSSGKTVISVDVPSGLDCDTGLVGNPSVRADVTVTMGFPKIGMLFFPGREYVGKLVVKELPYPAAVTARHLPRIYSPSLSDMRRMLPARKMAGTKHDHGLVFMLCGSRGMTGSATLASCAAFRTGCGMVHLAAPVSAVPVLSVKLTETVIHQIEETEDGTPSMDSLYQINQKAGTMNAVLAGPGISVNIESSRLVRDFISKLEKPLVLDADGLNAFKGCVSGLAQRQCELIITPHEGEWNRLFEPLSSIPEEKINSIVRIASQYKMTIVFKGSPVIVASPDGCAWIIACGNSGMATAGTGDVLAGIIVSLIAQGCISSDAAVLGACIHGLCGDCARENLSEYSVMAKDLIEAIPDIMKKLARPVIPAFILE